MGSKTVFGLALALLAAGDSRAAGGRLGILEVAKFEVISAVQLPADFQASLSLNLISRLQESGKFEEVVHADSGGSAAVPPAVRLTGEVTEFKRGSQAKRYLLGPGFGKTIVKAHIRFTEIGSGKVLLEKDVDGKVIIGVLGGDSKGATNGLAKEVAKVAKKFL